MTLGAFLPFWAILPFGVLLLGIAVLPLCLPHWWEKNGNKGLVSFGLALPLALYLVLMHGDLGRRELSHALMDYLAFIALLGSLFTISGGIHIKGSLAGTPLSNTVMLAIGAMLANLVGTTGASVLLIRPILRANAKRRRRAHVVVFFIFIVSNAAGLLTPLGDPPLFLGFLKGVPFDWTLRLWPQWLLVNGLLLGLFNIIDQIVLNREERERAGSQLEEVLEHRPVHIAGAYNFLFLIGVMAVIIAKGQALGMPQGTEWPFGVQEGLMAALAVGSYLSTSKSLHQANHFSFSPIIEVAVLFIGIFITMVPPLLILNARGTELGITSPAGFFWATGLLSGFLDNAPTYLAFAALACGNLGITLNGHYLSALIAHGPEAGRLLAAISCGAVFMGANTYIGNGPNFMVKAIAEENGVKMPSFFGYMGYSVAILIPIFAIITLMFFA